MYQKTQNISAPDSENKIVSANNVHIKKWEFIVLYESQTEHNDPFLISGLRKQDVIRSLLLVTT